MTRTFVAVALIFSGFLAIALPASAEDGGQYYRGGRNVVAPQDLSNFQR